MICWTDGNFYGSKGCCTMIIHATLQGLFSHDPKNRKKYNVKHELDVTQLTYWVIRIF